MDTIGKLEQDMIAATGKKIPDFNVGDTVKVYVKVREGERERTQMYEGVCIARKNAGFNSSFTVRKLSYGEGVERVFPLYSPVVDRIECVRQGDVRRAKLYYLRGRRGKSARITEKTDWTQAATAAEALDMAPDAVDIAKKAKTEDDAADVKVVPSKAPKMDMKAAKTA